MENDSVISVLSGFGNDWPCRLARALSVGADLYV